MSATGTPSAPAGWYPDPENPAHGRYWDGRAWTELRHEPGTPYPAAAAPKAPPGTDPYTPWIWAIVGIMFVPLVTLPLVPWASMFDYDLTDPYAAMASFEILLSPLYWLSVLLGWAAFALTIVFAYRDHKELLARGVPRPFHWGFAFLGVVYPIGRSVVVRARTGRGMAPLWISIGYIVVSIVASIVLMVVIFTAMVDSLSDLTYYSS